MLDLTCERRGFFHRIHDPQRFLLLKEAGRFYIKNTKSWVINDYVFFVGKHNKLKGDWFLGYGSVYGVYAYYETSLEEEQYMLLNNYLWAIQIDRLTLFQKPLPLAELNVDEIKATIKRRKQILDETEMDCLFEFIEEKIENKE